MKRLFSLVLATAMLMLAFPMGAQASIYKRSDSCSSAYSDYARPTVCFAENTGYTGDKLISDGASGSINLGYITHSAAGTCYAPIKVSDDYNDCLSSVQIDGLTTDWVCLYRHDGYNGFIASIRGTGGTVARGINNLGDYNNNDTLTSFRVYRGKSSDPCPRT